MSGQSLRVIFTYKKNGVWMFDDPGAGIHAEPFVSGAPEMIDRLTAGIIQGAEDGFALYFSDQPFPGHQVRLDWMRPECGGNWYKAEGNAECWLCPTLLCYFHSAPNNIYCRAEAK